MEAKELRIGNLVEIPTFNGTGDSFVADVNYGIFTVNSSIIRDAEYHKGDWAVRPIPLTEEWLVKFGFKNNGCYWESQEEYFELGQYENGEWVNSVNCFEYSHGIAIKYVHQLQNLYFALTGKELTITK